MDNTLLIQAICPADGNISEAGQMRKRYFLFLSHAFLIVNEY